MKKIFVYVFILFWMAGISVYCYAETDADKQFKDAVSLFRQAKYDKAIEGFTKSLELDGNMVFAHYYLGLLYEEKLLGEGNPGKALEIKNKAIESWSTFIQKGNDIDLKYLTTAKKHLKRLTEEGQNEQK